MFGLSVVEPFYGKTNYGDNTAMRYAATKSSVQTADVSFDIGHQLNRVMSIGAGLDVQYMHLTLNYYDGYKNPFTPSTPYSHFDTQSLNSMDSWALGYHLGMLFQFSPSTHVGIAYHSPVHYGLTGRSKYSGRLANFPQYGEQTSPNLQTQVTLPGYATASLFQRLNSRWAVMGAATYTWWHVMQDALLKGLVTAANPTPGNTTTGDLVQNYHNTWNFALGINYQPMQNLILKAGAGYNQTPVPNKFLRSPTFPGADSYSASFGLHYQFLKTMGIDLGYMHLFMKKVRLDNEANYGGIHLASTDGQIDGGANLYGMQFTWTFGK